jgi:hypothetical protein
MRRPGPTRRDALGLAGLAAASLAMPEAAVRAQEAARRGRLSPRIADVRRILSQLTVASPRGRVQFAHAARRSSNRQSPAWRAAS